jgi:hypothetical protein
MRQVMQALQHDRESDLAPGQAYRRRRHDARQAQIGTRGLTTRGKQVYG